MNPLPPDVELLRQQVRAERRADIQCHLGIEVDLETAKATLRRHSDWDRFKDQLGPGDKIREFDTVEPCGDSGFVSGERGYAIMRDGIVLSWIVTEIDT
jgi:hypothetical protein